MTRDVTNAGVNFLVRPSGAQAPLDGEALLSALVDDAERLHDIEALHVLLSARTGEIARRLCRRRGAALSVTICRYRDAISSRLAPLLQAVVRGESLTHEERSALVLSISAGMPQNAFALPTEDISLRFLQLQQVWPAFASWRQAYFAAADDAASTAGIVDLWDTYLPFALWILRRKRARPERLFVIGFNGSPGAGKTVMTNSLSVILNVLLNQEQEGQALARSGDDWYLPHAQRELLRPLGYDCRVPGLTNRAPPGTHDHAWLERNFREMEASDVNSVIEMGAFDKQHDEQPYGEPFVARGKIGVFLFDLWFAGAQADASACDNGTPLQRMVAGQLQRWQRLFARMDALWVYDWPSIERMIEEREAQEQLIEKRGGRRALSADSVRAFMRYMIEDCWDWSRTSPLPPDALVTFRTRRDIRHRIVDIELGGRP